MIVLMKEESLVGIFADTESMLSAMVADMEKTHYAGQYHIETVNI